MNEISEFFSKLLSPEGWPPRWHCGRWTDFHGWLYILADLAIWAAYFTIPITIVYFLSKKNVPFPRIFFLFASFILACGTTHLLDAVMFWFPAYRINALVRLGTAIVSWRTIIALWKIIPKALTMKTAAEFETELNQRIKADEKLIEANQQLEVLNKDLERSNSDLLQFATVASHDLKEPLRKMSTFSGLLATDEKSILSADGKLYLEKIQNASVRMDELIKDLLVFSQIGTCEDNFEAVNLNKTIAKVLDDLEVNITSKNAEIIIDELPEVSGIPAQISQLFQNLISNALKFVKPGVAPIIKISATTELTPVEKKYGLNPSHKFCKIIIEDNGIGFDNKYLDKIFTIFQRLHTREEYEGTGMGLAICKKIAEFHGGYITAHGEVGIGTKFIVFLPLS